MHRIASYIIAGVLLSAALFLHLIPSLFAGMLVYVLIHSCASMIPSGKAKLYSTAGLAVVFVGVLVYGMFALVSAMHGGGADLSALWEKLASIIEGADQILPGWVLESLPGRRWISRPGQRTGFASTRWRSGWPARKPVSPSPTS